MKTPPEPLLTLDEACQRYFPGKSACALRWMIKRRGYAHSRWGREYRLTDSQIAAIQADLARPARPDGERTAAASPVRRSVSHAQINGQPPAGGANASRGRTAGSSANSKRALAERLSAPLSATEPGNGR